MMYNQSNLDTRSQGMELASLTLGIAAVACCSCLYLSIPCGAMAILFAGLSRGGSMSYSSRALTGMILGVIALVLTTTIYGTSLAYALHEYGSIEGILDAYKEMSGMDYNELLQELYPEY